jgi:restriction system protein
MFKHVAIVAHRTTFAVSVKGIFVATSKLSREAEGFAFSIDSKVILIDGRRLAQLMIDFNIRVSTLATYKTQRLDTDYFSEE